MSHFRRVLVAPTLLGLTDVLLAAQDEVTVSVARSWRTREQWLAELPRILAAPEGAHTVRSQPGEGGFWLRLAWWRAPAGQRHFAIEAENDRSVPAVIGPPLRLIYPERVCYRGPKAEGGWVVACTCGSALEMDDPRLAGPGCVGCLAVEPVAPAHLTLVDCSEPERRAIRQHQAVIALSADEGTLAFLRDARLWVKDLRGGRIILDHREGRLTSVALSPDGRTLAAIGAGELLLWRVGEEGLLRLADSIRVDPSAVACFGSGCRLAAAWLGGGWVRGPDGECVGLRWPVEIATGRVSAIATDPEGHALAVFIAGSDVPAECLLFHRDAGGMALERRISLPRARYGRFSPNARYLAWWDDGDGISLQGLCAEEPLGPAGALPLSHWLWQDTYSKPLVPRSHFAVSVHHRHGLWRAELDGRLDQADDAPVWWTGRVAEAWFRGEELWLRMQWGHIHRLPLSVFPGMAGGPGGRT